MPSLPPSSQTLARGIGLLDLLSESATPLTIAEIAERADLHRSVAYRLLRTLEDFGLVARRLDGRLTLGPHIAVLARGVAPDLQSSARPVLQQLADELGMTAFLVVLDRAECVTLTTLEPTLAIASIAQRPGSRHPVGVGAPGLAIQTLLSTTERVERGLSADESDEVVAARTRGWAASHGEVIPGVTAVAAPVRAAIPAALAVLRVGEDVPAEVGERIRDAARRLTGRLG